MVFCRSILLPAAALLSLSLSGWSQQSEQAATPTSLETNGPSFSLVASLQGQYQQLGKKVTDLKADIQEEHLKKSTLSVAMERAKAAMDAGVISEAKELLNDVEKLLPLPAHEMATPGTETNTVSALRMPRVPSENPYIDRLVAGAMQEMTTPDVCWPKNRPGIDGFAGAPLGTNPRTLGEKMHAWLWLLVNPASPLKGNPAVLERFLRVAHAYADAMEVRGMEKLTAKSLPATTEAGTEMSSDIFDKYAIAPACNALREFSQIYPHLLTPAQKAPWDRAMHLASIIMNAEDEYGYERYSHTDAMKAYVQLNLGLYLQNKSCLEHADELLHLGNDQVYKDGGLSYIWHQNDIGTDHDTFTAYLGLIHEITGDTQILEQLRKTEWYGPVSGGKIGEFWTAPSWKDQWNSTRAWAGGEAVACITGNPYLRTMLDKILLEKTAEKSWARNRPQISWYRNDVKPLPLPDNFTIMDHNIMGPRAWYGRFNYAATLRDIPLTEPGLSTLMGAQVTEPDGGIENILMGVYPRVRLMNVESGDTVNHPSVYARLTSGLQSQLVMGRTFSAFAGSYRLHKNNRSVKGPDSDWNGRQLWLGLPDRIIGLIEVSPMKENAQAWDIEGVIRLGVGGTVYGKPTKLESTGKGGNGFRYGDLLITIFAHNFAGIETHEIPFRKPQAPITEITLLDEKGAAHSQNSSSYQSSARYWFAIEIRPSWVSDTAKVHRLDHPDGVFGFTAVVGGKTFDLLDNRGPSRMEAEIPKTNEGVQRSFWSSLSKTPVTTPPSSLILKPQELAVVVSSPDAEDHKEGWTTYQQMLASHTSQHSRKNRLAVE